MGAAAARERTEGFETALRCVVRTHFGSEAQVARLERLTGGASQELWAFDVETPTEVRALILRRNPGGAVKRETAAGMETEARLLGLAAGVEAPVPEVVLTLAPEDGLGSGYIMARLDGVTLPRQIQADPAFAGAREVLAGQLGAAAARIHRIPIAEAGDLRRTSPTVSLDAAMTHYRALGMDRPVVEWAFRWLSDHLPSPEFEPRVVHGDLRAGNVMVGPEGLRAVLDWEVVHIGDPMEDLGWICVPSWRFGELDKPAGGFGTREALYAGYEAESGRTVDPARVRFWEVLGTLRWGLSCAMMAREFQASDRSVERAAIGRRASETDIDLLAMLAPRGGPSLA